MAWNTILNEGEEINDQDGHFCGVRNAYGPYQARKLREKDYSLALINNENYGWFFLVSLCILVGNDRGRKDPLSVDSTRTGRWCVRRRYLQLPRPFQRRGQHSSSLKPTTFQGCAIKL